MSHYNLVIYCTFCQIYLFPPQMAGKFYSKPLGNRTGNFVLSFECILIKGPFWVQDPLQLFLYSAFEMPWKGCQGVFIILMVEIHYSSARRHWTAYRDFERALSLFIFHVTHRLPSWLLIFPKSKWCAICLMCILVRIQHISYELI